jgi:hypothetical protein
MIYLIVLAMRAIMNRKITCCSLHSGSWGWKDFRNACGREGTRSETPENAAVYWRRQRLVLYQIT